MKHWEEVVKQAAHYLAIGQSEVYLDSGDDVNAYPWELADSCEPGGSHRLDISTDVWFRAEHKSGLGLRWSFEIEPHTANGSGTYQIDTAKIRRVMDLLKPAAASAFRRYLLDCSAKVAARGNEYQKHADRQRLDALVLQRLGEGKE